MPARVHAAAREFRHHRRVFVAPPWPEICANDRERTQSLAEAERTFESMVATYPEYGYELVTLPKSTPEERVRFVRSNLDRN